MGNFLYTIAHTDFTEVACSVRRRPAARQQWIAGFVGRREGSADVEAAAPARLLTVTLNPALDLTYAAARLTPGSVHRTPAPQIRSGGKGINAGRVAALLGAEAVVTGLAGGLTGAMIRARIPGTRLADGFLPSGDDSRRTITVLEADGRCTAFNEEGPVISAQEWARFERHFADLAGEFQAVALFREPAAWRARRWLCPAHQDRPRLRCAGGPRHCGGPLRAALPARPDVIKPNRDEVPSSGIGQAAHELQGEGAGAVVASLGSEGMLAVTCGGCWQARPPARLRGNPTGAGDACVAALLLGLARGLAWPDTVRLATAVSAAAVASPVAGEADLALALRLHPEVSVDRACH